MTVSIWRSRLARRARFVTADDRLIRKLALRPDASLSAAVVSLADAAAET